MNPFCLLSLHTVLLFGLKSLLYLAEKLSFATVSSPIWRKLLHYKWSDLSSVCWLRLQGQTILNCWWANTTCYSLVCLFCVEKCSLSHLNPGATPLLGLWQMLFETSDKFQFQKSICCKPKMVTSSGTALLLWRWKDKIVCAYLLNNIENNLACCISRFLTSCITPWLIANLVCWTNHIGRQAYNSKALIIICHVWYASTTVLGLCDA